MSIQSAFIQLWELLLITDLVSTIPILLICSPSHLLLDIANEISIEVKHCPTLGCFGQYSDFYFPLAWENMQLKIQNVPIIQAINGALFKPFSVKPFPLVYFYISFYWALWQFYSLANRSKQGVQNGHMKAKTSGNVCTNLCSSSTGHKARIIASPVNKEIRQEIQSYLSLTIIQYSYSIFT